MTFDPNFEEFKRKRELERTRRIARGDESDSDLHLPRRRRNTPATGHPVRRRTRPQTNDLLDSGFGL
jgi:hypothetical protein